MLWLWYPRVSLDICHGAECTNNIKYLTIDGTMTCQFLKAMGLWMSSSFHKLGQLFGDKYGDKSNDNMQNQNIDNLTKHF